MALAEQNSIGAGKATEEMAKAEKLTKLILAHCLSAGGEIASRNCPSCAKRVFAKWSYNSKEALEAAAACHAWVRGKNEEDWSAMAAATTKRKRYPCLACGKQLADLEASLKAHAHSTPCRFACPGEMLKEIEVEMDYMTKLPTCHICLKRFGCEDSMRQHLEDKHPGCYAFDCPPQDLWLHEQQVWQLHDALKEPVPE